MGAGEYLPHKFRDDKRELDRTSDLVKDVARTFEAFVDDRGWPYELEDRIAAGDPSDSQSTNAMILFALAAVAGKAPRDSPLLPAATLRDPVTFEGASSEAFRKARQGLKDAVTSYLGYTFDIDSRKQSHVSWSSSFGWDDPFTLTWMLELGRGGAFDGDDGKTAEAIATRAAERVREAFKFSNGQADTREGLLLTWRPSPQLDAPQKERLKDKTREGNRALDHSFPLLRFVHLREALRRGGTKCDVSDDAVSRALHARVHEQLSKAEIQDGSFDPAELVFALEGVLLLQPNLMSRSLLDRIFSVLTRSQAQSPYWRPVKPFVSRAQGHVLLPVSVETATSLLRCCTLAGIDHPDRAWFSDNATLFAQYVEWLRQRHRKGSCPGKSGRARPFRGWHSEHVHLHQGIHLWETSQVLMFLAFYTAMFDEHVADQSLRAANLTRSRPWKRDQKKHADYWADRDVGDPLAALPADSSLKILDGYAARHLVLPRPHPDGGPVKEKGGPKHYSALLYGPPGTGKTSFAEELCTALRWPLITITPSDFIHGGESEIEARAKLIFDVLEAQSDVVILFDEIDRLILDRDSTLYEQQADIFQFMTPGMLTKLAGLRKRKRAIFLIATNYEERIDAAIKRRGRIDQKCLVAPPDRQARTLILRKLLNEHVKELNKGRRNEEKLPASTAAEQVRLGEIAKSLRLTVYGELKELFEEAAVGGDWSTAQFLDRLEKRAQGASPAIRLLSYRARFPANDEEGAERRGAKPFAEFLLLTYLRLEDGGRLEDQERKLARQVLHSLMPDWPDGGREAQEQALMKQLNDRGVVRGLLNGLDREAPAAS